MSELIKGRPADKERYNLSPREWDVYCLVMTGIYNHLIAEKLFISPKTVKFHLTSIFKKCGVKNKQELMALDRARREGLV